GVSAGFCFGAKQNIGIYALSTSLVALSVKSRELEKSAFICWLPALAGFGVVVSVTMLPVILSGGLEKFLDYGFINKRTYLESAGISYFDGVLRFFFASMIRPWKLMIIALVQSQIFLMPAIAFIGLLVAVAFDKKNGRGRAITVVCLIVASALSVYPRADELHISFVAPGFLIAAIYSWHVLKTRMGTGLALLSRTSLWLLVLASISLKLWLSCKGITTAECVWSDLPHLRYKLLRATD